MPYGNCLIGAIVLALWLRKFKPIILWRGRIVPHIMMIGKDNKYYHYKLVSDFWPPPLCFLCFRGCFACQERIYTKEYKIVDFFLDKS
jgi:hypothetical protein